MTFDEFWFKRTFPQIFTLLQARIERNERAEKDSKKGDAPRETATETDMRAFIASLGG